jgi:hypothetical protein
MSLAGCSAVALLQGFVRGNDANDCNDWAPLMIDYNAPAISGTGLSHSQHHYDDVSGAIDEQRSPQSKSRSSSAPPRSLFHSPARHTVTCHLHEYSQPFRSSNATSESLQSWGRSSEPRLKRVIAAPGPGTYSPIAPKSSVQVIFGRSVNHKLPFRASYCEENFISHQAIPDANKLFGSASAISFTRRSRVLQLTASSSDQIAKATCSSFIGPGTYEEVRSKLGSAKTSGHSIPRGPRGTDLRLFRNNRVLKHTYGPHQNDDIIGAFAHTTIFFFFCIQPSCLG